ncbi:MAG: hypothetical protein AAF214_02870 [Pseudomonadota bacterium]
MAEKLSGKEVASLMGAGPLAFQAGSVGVFKADGSFDFQHRNSGEAGTFKVFSNGNVEIHDTATNKRIRFYFDRGADGVALIYTSGPGKGKRYPLK